MDSMQYSQDALRGKGELRIFRGSCLLFSNGRSSGCSGRLRDRKEMLIRSYDNSHRDLGPAEVVE